MLICHKLLLWANHMSCFFLMKKRKHEKSEPGKIQPLGSKNLGGTHNPKLGGFLIVKVASVDCPNP